MANMAQAIRMALHYGEEHLGVTDIFGEDVGPPLGGVFTATQGSRPRGTRRSTSAASSARRSGSRSRATAASPRSSSATTSSTRSTCSSSPATQCWASNGDWNLPMVVMTPGRQRHPRIDLPLALVRRDDDAHPGLEDRHAVDPARRLRADALVPAGSESDDVPQAQGAAARPRHGADPGRAAATPEARRASRDDRQPVVGDTSKWKPRWPKELTDYVGRDRQGQDRPRGRARHGRELRPHAAALRPGRRAAARKRGSRPRSSICARSGRTTGR